MQNDGEAKEFAALAFGGEGGEPISKVPPNFGPTPEDGPNSAPLAARLDTLRLARLPRNGQEPAGSLRAHGTPGRFLAPRSAVPRLFLFPPIRVMA